MADEKKTDKPEEKPEEKKREISQAEKDSIIREAVSYYLRNDFRMPEIREVCEEFIAAADKKARGDVEKAEHPAQHPAQHHEHPPAVSEYNKPKTK